MNEARSGTGISSEKRKPDVSISFWSVLKALRPRIYSNWETPGFLHLRSLNI